MSLKLRYNTLFVLALLLIACGCNRRGRLRVLPLTHVAIDKSAKLIAYEEKGRPVCLEGSADAASTENMIQNVNATWGVSDPGIALVGSDGTIKGLKPGRVTVSATWEGQQVVTAIEVVPTLSADWLPQMSAEKMHCPISEIKLSLSSDRTLRFRLGFDDSKSDIALEAKAPPEQQLPWEFPGEQGSLLLKNASGKTVTGELRLKSGTTVQFTVWSDDNGTYPVSLRGKTVVLIGDSMAEGLGWFLRAKVGTAGGRYIIASWQSSTIGSWESGRLKKLLERDKPDVLFISLGSNELFIKNPEQTRAPQIRQMTKDIGDVPAYWIGPPSWKPDNGLVRVIQDNFQPEHFYNSNDLKVPRRGDGAHPTREGFETWANLVWDWYVGIG